MNRRIYQIGMALQWLVLPLIALRYWMVWDQLPASIATHFNGAGKANGWMTPGQSLAFTFGLSAFLLTVFTILLYVMQKKHAAEAVSWAFLGLSCLLIGLIFYGNESILAYNLHGRPIAIGPFLLITPLAILVFMAIYLGSKRGAPLPAQTWLAEEVHGSKIFASLFLIPLMIEFGAMKAIPLQSVRLGLGLLAAMFLVFAVQAWTGFHYRFGASGVEISTLGFRLRSIPRSQISAYAEKSWNPLGGYGIRGIGSKRAYVWGNSGVLIKTLDGEVFLGHNQPQQIIRDLDLMKQYVHS